MYKSKKSPEIKIKTSNSSTNKTHSKKRRRKGGKQMATILTSAGVNISPNHGVALIEVARESDFGVNDKRYTVFSHLAYVLKAGDTCLGYDMAHMVINDDDAKGLDRDSVSEIILVKKSYPKWRKKVKTRNWQLKSLVNNADGGAGFGIVGKPREKGEDARMQQDKEMFLRDLEEDEDMRNKINLYKLDKNDINPSKDKNYTTDEENEEIEDDIPVINVENLLDNMNLSGENEKTNSADDDL